MLAFGISPAFLPLFAGAPVHGDGPRGTLGALKCHGASSIPPGDEIIKQGDVGDCSFWRWARYVTITFQP